MRFREFKLVEQDQKPGFYSVGDSHAVGLANYAGKPWISKAKNGTRSTDPMHKAAIASIPKGSTVAISLGANDAQDIKANPQAVATSVANVVNAAKQQGLNVYFLLFPVGTKPNGEIRANVREAIKSAIDVPVIDLEGSKLVDGVHADASAYKKAASSIISSAPAATPENISSKNNTQVASTNAFSLAVPKSNRGPDVADLQKALVALGYTLPRYGVDGIRGTETSGAIRKFQQDNQLNSTGAPDQQTIDKINAILASKPDIAASLKKSTVADVQKKGPAKMPPLSQDAATKGKVGELLNFIARYESRGNYNIILGGRTVPELTKMTLSQVYDFQRDMVRQGSESSAVGRYQYIRSSLEMVAKQMGLDPNKTIFDPKTQDEIAIYDLRKRAGLDSWLNGQLDDGAFLNNVAKIWAGIPTTSGSSFYAGVGSNKAGTDNSSAIAALQNIKSGTTQAA